MMRRRWAAILLTMAMVCAVAMSGCGAKSSSGGEAAKAPEATEAPAVPEVTETVVTADTRDEAGKLADAFYGDLAKANPVCMSSYYDGETASVFTIDGDTIHIADKSSDAEYYLFIENGTKYTIEDGETAYEDEFMYDLFSESVANLLDIFVTGYYDMEDDGTISYSATRTDKTENGVTTSTLVSVISGEEDGQAVTVTVTGTAENGVVSRILYEIDSAEEKESAEFRFTYDNISVKLPAYTIGEGSGGFSFYDANVEGEHVDSPYQTLAELIATLDEDETLLYTMEEGHVYAIGEKDGRQYQFSAAISEEDMDEINNMDFFSDTYYEDIYAILGKLTVDDCIDYTDCLVPQGELDGFVGKTVQELVDAGYEMSGWSIYDGVDELTFTKDYMEYTVKAKPTEGFDENSEFEKEELYGFTVEQIGFSGPEYMALPIR